MRIFILLIGIILISPVPAAIGAETLTCDYRETLEGGGAKRVGLRLTVEGREVTGISYHNTVTSGREGGGYICAFDVSVSDGKSTWTRKGSRTLVELKGEKKSTFEIRRSQKGYTLLFHEMSLEYCGFGAEFPEQILMEKGRKECRVKFE